MNNILWLRKVQYVCIGDYAGNRSLSMDYAMVKVTKQRRIYIIFDVILSGL
jgi:hypothetical protein